MSRSEKSPAVMNRSETSDILRAESNLVLRDELQSIQADDVWRSVKCFRLWHSQAADLLRLKTRVQSPDDYDETRYRYLEHFRESELYSNFEPRRLGEYCIILANKGPGILDSSFGNLAKIFEVTQIDSRLSLRLTAEPMEAVAEGRLNQLQCLLPAVVSASLCMAEDWFATHIRDEGAMLQAFANDLATLEIHEFHAKRLGDCLSIAERGFEWAHLTDELSPNGERLSGHDGSPGTMEPTSTQDAYIQSKLGQRDRWVYENRKAGMTNPQVVKELERIFAGPGWTPLTSDQSIRDAVKRWILKAGAPSLPPASGGRLVGKNPKAKTAQ